MKKHRLQGKLVKVSNTPPTWIEARIEIPNSVIIQGFLDRQSKVLDQIQNPLRDRKKLGFFRPNY